MSGKLPQFITEYPRNEKPLLIVDKDGLLGNTLLSSLGQEYLTVFVSGVLPKVLSTSVHIPYGNHIPRIPDNNFAKIVVFYSGEKETMTMLHSLAKKRDETGGDLFFCLPLSLASQHLLLEIEKRDPKARIVIYGEPFGQDVLEPNQTMAFFRQIHLYGKIFIPNTGLHFVYPMLLDDIVLLLISVIFSDDKPRRPILLFAKHPPTALSVARMIVKQDPSIKLDFYTERGLSEPTYIPSGEYVHPQYDLGDALKRSRLLMAPLLPGLSPKQAKVKRKRGYKKTIIAAAVVILIILLPIFIAFLGTGLGGFLLGISQQELERGNLVEAKIHARFAGEMFSLSEKPATVLSLLTKGTILAKPTMSFMTLTLSGDSLSGIELEVVDAVVRFQAITNERSLDPASDFLQGTTEVKEALVTVQGLQAGGELPPTIAKKLAAFSELENTYASIQSILPSLFGFQGPKNYLLLFQNNMELRPGGGFIGSYATFTLDRGRLTNFAIHNVYDADGKLTGHIEPPYPLRRYMQTKHWFLRDSNFDVDFGVDAKQAAQFLKLETGEQADVVIGVDVSFLQSLLKATGPIDLPDYNQSVTPNNVYLLTEEHAEDNFFPGSTEKQDFLRSVFSSLLLRLISGKHVSYTTLLSQVIASINSKHILVASIDDPTERLLAVSGLSSSLTDERQEGVDRATDYLSVNEANVGANKANYYLKRSLEQEVAFADNGDETSALTLTYDNTSSNMTPFGGDYKTYVRFLIPQNATVQNITINGEDQTLVPAVIDPAVYESPRFTPPAGLEVNTTDEEGKKLVGFLLIVPKGETETVQIDYTQVHPNLFSDNSFTYDLLVLKQPGTGNDPYSLTLRYPDDARVVPGENETMTDLGGKLVFVGQLTKDQHIVVGFSKK